TVSNSSPPRTRRGRRQRTAPSRETAGGTSTATLENKTLIPRELLDPSRAVHTVEIPGVPAWRHGKVRSIFEAGPDHFVIVASDRLSAYDSILPTPIPGKGAMLSRLSAWWMRHLQSAPPHHLVSDDPQTFPAPFREHA